MLERGDEAICGLAVGEDSLARSITKVNKLEPYRRSVPAERRLDEAAIEIFDLVIGSEEPANVHWLTDQLTPIQHVPSLGVDSYSDTQWLALSVAGALGKK